MIWRFLSFHLFQILAEEHFQFIKWYIVTLATIVEIAIRARRDLSIGFWWYRHEASRCITEVSAPPRRRRAPSKARY